MLQCELALQLTRNVSIIIPGKGCGIHKIERFLAVKNIAVMIYNLILSVAARIFPTTERYSPF